MKLPPFLLDHWLDQKFSANPPIEYDLGSSTGPVWSLRELLALAGDNASEPGMPERYKQFGRTRTNLSDRLERAAAP
jgi:hypothetical protein